MKITYDKQADAMYIYFRKGEVSKTAKVSGNVLIDLDMAGNALGMELLGVSKQMSKKEINRVQMEIPAYS